MKIRSATINDFEKWHQLRLKLWAHVSAEESLESFENVLRNHSQEQIFLAENADGELVGFLEAGLRRDYVEGCETSPVGYIEGWFVEANLRRQKIGLKLVEAAEDWARELGCREMASDCELENVVSLRAHLGVGYAEASRNIHFTKSL